MYMIKVTGHYYASDQQAAKRSWPVMDSEYFPLTFPTREQAQKYIESNLTGDIVRLSHNQYTQDPPMPVWVSHRPALRPLWARGL